MKPAEYGGAGVPFYGRVETEPAVEVCAYELLEGAYVERVRLREGSASLPGPYPLTVDLDALR